MEFPQDKTTFDIEQEFMVGDSLLIKAVAQANQLTTSVYLPGTGVWYDVATGNQVSGMRVHAASCTQHRARSIVHACS